MSKINSQVMASSTSKASKFSYAVNNHTALFKLVDNFGAVRYFDSYNDAEACRAALTEMREGFKAALYFKKGRSWEPWEIPAENIVEIPAPVQVNDYAGTIDLSEATEADSADAETPEAKIALSDDIYADAAQRMADAYAGGCCEMPSFWMGGSDDDYMDNKIAEALGTDVTYVWEHIDINYDRLWSMAYDKWVEDRKKAIKSYIDDELANDPTFAEHLAILNGEQGDDFNLVYEVGSYIYYGLTDSTGEPVYDDSEVADVVSMYDWSMDADGVYWSEKEPVLEAYGEPVVVESNDGNKVAKMAC